MEQRHRSSILQHQILPCQRTYTDKDGSTYPYAYSEAGTQETKQITDIVDKGFCAQFTDGGELPLRPMTIRRWYQESVADVHVDQHVSYPLSKYQGPYALHEHAVLPDLEVPFGAEDAVVSEAIADAKSVKFDLLTFMAELPNAARMIKGNINGVFDIRDRVMQYSREGYRRARRRNNKPIGPGEIRELKDYAAKKWLEARYGYRPLVYDIEDIFAAIARERSFVSEGRGHISWDLSNFVSQTTDRGTTLRTLETTISGTGTVRSYSRYIAENIDRISVNPLVTGWELIPFSFLVDRFINIGNWFKAISPVLGLRHSGTLVSVKREYVINTKYWWHTKAGSVWTCLPPSQDGVFRHEVEEYERRLASTPITPGVDFRITPGVVTDIAALVLSRRARSDRILLGL